MKRRIVALLCLALVLFACGRDREAVQSQGEGGRETPRTTEKAAVNAGTRAVESSDSELDNSMSPRSSAPVTKQRTAERDTVTYEGVTYECGTSRSGYMPCRRQRDGSSSYVNWSSADIWCRPLGGCVEYDPEEYFEVRSQGSYLCSSQLGGGYGEYDCYEYFGGRPPMRLGSPELYCSGSRTFPDCSSLWYPDELRRYDVREMSGDTYICKDAVGMYSSYGDMDCALYSGGDPGRVSYTNALKCSDGMGGFECRRDYYPSEAEDVEWQSIDGGTYACESTYEGYECWRYYSGSPKSAMYGSPDYYCNRYGCATRDYPEPESRY